MKASAHIFTALYLLFVSACEKPETKYGFDKPIKIFEGESIHLAENSFTVSSLEINDSRCPKNAVCIWQGYAIVRLNLRSGADTLKNISLCTGGCSIASLDTAKTFRLNSKDYIITLNEVGKEKDKEYARVVISQK